MQIIKFHSQSIFMDLSITKRRKFYMYSFITSFSLYSLACYLYQASEIIYFYRMKQQDVLIKQWLLRPINIFDRNSLLLSFISVSFAGVAVNIFNICFLVKERSKLEFAPSFVQLLILLSIFDLLVLIVEIGIFGFPAISTWYTANVYFSILPTW